MVSVVICTYNRGGSLRSTLESLSKISLPADFSWELVLVDNNSSDDTRSVVENSCSEFKLPVRYVLETSQGLSHARNRGICEASGELIVFTDDDVLIAKDWLVEIKSTFDEFGCLALGGKIVADWPTSRPSWFEDQGPFALGQAIISCDLGNEVCRTKKIPIGANMAFRKQAFEKYGLFRTDLGRGSNDLMGGEEWEFFRRLQENAEVVCYTPRAVVHHPVPRQRISKSYFRRWYYNFGKTDTRLNGFPSSSIRYFGVPRFLGRMMVESLFMWLFSVGAKKRFYYESNLYYLAGRIAEARSQRRSKPGSLQKGALEA
jgi:glycosyltransferase involved in cell wall biosynthesis